MREIVWKATRLIIYEHIFLINKIVFRNNAKRNFFLIYFAVNAEFLRF